MCARIDDIRMFSKEKLLSRIFLLLGKDMNIHNVMSIMNHKFAMSTVLTHKGLK